MNKIARVIFVTILSLLSMPAWASEREPRLKIEFIGNLPPYSFMQDGLVAGVDIEIVSELFSRMDLDISMDLVPWARLILRAEEGAIDAVGATFCEGESKWRKFLEHSDPLYTSSLSFFSLVPNNDSENKILSEMKEGGGATSNIYLYSLISSDKNPISSLAELEGKSIGKVRDYYYRKELKDIEAVDFYDFLDDDLLLRSLLMKRIDFAIAEELPFNYFCKMHNSCHLIQESYTFENNPICLAFPTAGNKNAAIALKEKVNAAIKELKADGFIDAVVRKYRN